MPFLTEILKGENWHFWEKPLSIPKLDVTLIMTFENSHFRFSSSHDWKILRCTIYAVEQLTETFHLPWCTMCPSMSFHLLSLHVSHSLHHYSYLLMWEVKCFYSPSPFINYKNLGCMHVLGSHFSLLINNLVSLKTQHNPRDNGEPSRRHYACNHQEGIGIRRWAWRIIAFLRRWSTQSLQWNCLWYLTDHWPSEGKRKFMQRISRSGHAVFSVATTAQMI